MKSPYRMNRKRRKAEFLAVKRFTKALIEGKAYRYRVGGGEWREFTAFVRDRDSVSPVDSVRVLYEIGPEKETGTRESAC